MEFEGCSLTAYWDKYGKVWTIGYGATHYLDGSPVKKGDMLSSKEEAREILLNMVERIYEPVVTNNVTSEITDNQRDALTSFVYNVGSGNFKNSTLLRMVNNNPNNRLIANEFLKWNKSGGKVLNGLTRRRAAESALYFDMSNVDVKAAVEVGDGNGNMFTELSNSSDWKMNEFKIIPRKSNNWKTLTSGSVHPVVGDILFGFHDADKSGRHDHVAIYLGVHDGSKYVAEGISVAGENINQTDTKVHIAKIEDSRLGLESDIITHFAHCLKTEIKQYEPPKPDYTLTADSTISTDTPQINLKTKVLGDKYKFTLQMPENNPTIEKNLTDLVNNILEPLQDVFPGKITITSGYRSPAKNNDAGGVPTSEHLTGQAVDMVASTSNLSLAKCIVDHNLPYRQLIIEGADTAYESNNKLHIINPRWIHVSYNPSRPKDFVKYTLYKGRRENNSIITSSPVNIKNVNKLDW